MSFSRANIDRAIVMIQYDLRGFAHPLGFREDYKLHAKSLNATTGNLLAIAAGWGGGKLTDKHYADYLKSSYEEYLAMCQRLVKACDKSEYEAIQLIIREIVKQSSEMKAEVIAGKRLVSNYLRPLEKGNCWGKAVLALMEAFEVKLEQTHEP